MTQTAEEMMSKMTDSKYFRERFFWIVNKESKKVPFIQNPPQSNYYQNKTNYDLILKARKEGFSTEVEGDFLFDCMTKDNIHAVTMSHTLDDTKVHLNRIKYYIQTCGLKDTRFKVTLDKENEKELYFPGKNSYYWIGTAGSAGFGRGRDINRLHCSEVAHYEDQAVLTAVLEACTKDARRVLETTANGVGELFHEMWEEAGDRVAGSPWKQHFYAWFMDPTNALPIPENYKFSLSPEESRMVRMIEKKYKLTISAEQVFWYRTKRASMADKSLMPQEYPSTPEEAFISSGRHVFSLSNLSVMDSRCVEAGWVGELDDDGKTVTFVSNPEGRFSIWKNPQPEREYLIAADVAKGITDGAFSVAAVFDRASKEVVAEWRARLDPGMFGQILAELGWFYNDALLAPENNNHGWACLERLKAIGYRHILKTQDIWKDEKKVDFGFPTDEGTKGLILSALRNSIDNYSYYENSKVAIREMQRAVFDDHGKMISQVGIKRKGRADARGDKGFLDCVITRGIGLYCLKFLSLDETYRRKDSDRSPIVVSQLIPREYGEKRKSFSRTGYR